MGNNTVPYLYSSYMLYTDEPIYLILFNILIHLEKCTKYLDIKISFIMKYHAGAI